MSSIEGPMIKSLQKLLCPESDDEDHSAAASSSRGFGPGDIGQKDKKATRNVTPWRTDKPEQPAPTAPDGPSTSSPLAQQPPAAPKSLEEFEELQPPAERYMHHKQPEYRYIYRQAVGTEDIFFGLNNRNPSTASCEDIILEIDLPGEQTPMHQMKLDISEQSVTLATDMYYLDLTLVQTIDVHRCSAEFDVNKEQMRVKMRAVREFDICHF